jgi:hypothetical protein
MAIDTTAPAGGPLAGLTVLDTTLALAGPFATFLLAGLGARVIKIEHPDSPDPCRQNPPFLGAHGVSLGPTTADDVSVSALNRLRGKYAVTLNLKQPRAPDVFADLLRHADVVVENFSAGTLDRLGVGYAAGRAINPRVIYCSISGFGATPAAAGTGRAMDSIIQALSGLMMTSGAPGDPPVRFGVPMADHPRIDRTASGVADAKSIERPRAEVLDDHVGVAEQVGKHVARARLLQVERDGVFSSQPVQCRHRHIVSRGRAEAHAMGAQKRRVLSAGIRRVRVLDLDDARTEAGEQERGKRTGQREGGIENRETGERSSGGSGGVDSHQASGV